MFTLLCLYQGKKTVAKEIHSGGWHSGGGGNKAQDPLAKWGLSPLCSHEVWNSPAIRVNVG